MLAFNIYVYIEKGILVALRFLQQPLGKLGPERDME